MEFLFLLFTIFQIDIRGNQLLTTPIKDINMFEFLYIYVLAVFAALFAKKIKLKAAVS